MTASELNRLLFELNQVNPELAARAEEASVIAVCFAHFEGCSEEALLATRAGAVAGFVPGTSMEFASQMALDAMRSFLNGHVEGKAARQVRALVQPLNLASHDHTAG